MLSSPEDVPCAVQDNSAVFFFHPGKALAQWPHRAQDFSPLRLQAQPEEGPGPWLVGSFSSWRRQPDLVMEASNQGWLLELPWERVNVPGNSGVPEFYFLDAQGRHWGPAAPCPPGRCHQGNWWILPQGEIPGPRLARILEQAEALDLDRTEIQDPRVYSNFRQLAAPPEGRSRLWRSYHPFIASKVNDPREPLRQEALARFLEELAPQAIVNLSDGPEDLERGAPSLYQSLHGQGRVLFVELDYEDAYYDSQGARMSRALGASLEFLAGIPGKALIHCRLGTDRTGMICALLQVLGAVPRHLVIQDYLKSNRCLMDEHREPELLVHGVSRFLGESWSEEPQGMALLAQGRLAERCALSLGQIQESCQGLWKA